VLVCILRYATCNAHAPYCYLWPAPHYHIFPHYLIKGTIFEKQLLNTKCVFLFPVQQVRNVSKSKKNWARYDQKCLVIFMLNARYSFAILMKLVASRQFLTNIQISNLIKILPLGAEFFPCGRTDRGTDMAMLIDAFRNFANAPQSDYIRPFCIVRRHY
jgi:hypothetical protein